MTTSSTRHAPLPASILSALFARAAARKPRLGLFGKADEVDRAGRAAYADEWGKHPREDVAGFHVYPVDEKRRG